MTPPIAAKPISTVHVPLDCALLPDHQGTVALIGNLDGVHIGHQALIRETCALAATLGAPPAAILFDPHPTRVFRDGVRPFLLTTLPERIRLLGAYGIERALILPFIPALWQQTPQAFIAETLHARLGLRGVVTGADFQFGRDRAGNADMLHTLAKAHGMAVKAVPLVGLGPAQRTSSSEIRRALEGGHIELATQMLGRPWRIKGEVVQGQALARTLGTPTANIPLGEHLRPRFGVYVVEVDIDGRRVGGVANIGTRPTVGGTDERLEVHLFDFAGDLYGRQLGVDLLGFIRAEQTFDGLDALTAQIARDIAEARRFLGLHAFGVVDGGGEKNL